MRSDDSVLGSPSDLLGGPTMNLACWAAGLTGTLNLGLPPCGHKMGTLGHKPRQSQRITTIVISQVNRPAAPTAQVQTVHDSPLQSRGQQSRSGINWAQTYRIKIKTCFDVREHLWSRLGSNQQGSANRIRTPFRTPMSPQSAHVRQRSLTARTGVDLRQHAFSGHQRTHLSRLGVKWSQVQIL